MIIRIISHVVIQTFEELFQNPLYWIAILSVYIIYERRAPLQSLRLTVLSVFQGLLVGILITSIIVGLGIYIQQEWVFGMLFPTALLLAKVRIRWMCYAYSSALLCVILKGMGILQNYTASAMLCIVGILHIAESLLSFRVKEEERIWPVSMGVLVETMSQQTVGMPGWWPILGGTVCLAALPVTAMLAYRCPPCNNQKAWTQLLVYGCIILGLGIVSSRIPWILFPSLLLQVILHEIITESP